MASEIEFIEYVVAQMEDLGNVRYRKMFDEENEANLRKMIENLKDAL